jgi:pSer/pThr/pTyr-binding forkhead associated (FHA) protein
MWLSQERPEAAASQYGEDEFVVVIRDKSSNGTYVNGVRIGRGNKVVLSHNARIELTQKKKNSKFVPARPLHIPSASRSHPPAFPLW